MTDFVYLVPVHYLYYGHYAVYYADTTPVLRQYYADTTPLLHAICGIFVFWVFTPGHPGTKSWTLHYADTTPFSPPHFPNPGVGVKSALRRLLRRYYAGTTPILRRPCAQNPHPCWGFLRLPRLVKMGCRNITNDTAFVKAGVYKIRHIC